MDELHEQLLRGGPTLLAWGGVAIGAVFGASVQLTNFCAMGSLSDIASFEDYRRFRAWLLAIATALIGAQALQRYGVADLGRSMYLTTGLNWFGNILGGLVFGIGMVFAGGCASRNLVRLGGGDLRAGVVLVVMGIFAYATVGGLLGPARALAERHTTLALPEGTTQSVGALLAHGAGWSPETAALAVAALLSGALLAFCFWSAEFRASPRHIAGGLLVGLCVVAGWALTGLAFDEMADVPVNPQSLSYVRPTGDALEYFERFTANPVPGFGVATVLGALAGAFASALAARRFRLTGFADPADTLRNLAGAALMGIGGVTALGCTIGQAVTGVSTLALGSLLAAVAIMAGGLLGLRLLERLLTN